MVPGKQRRIGIGMLVLVNLIWAGSFPAMAIAVQEMSPLLLTLIRLGTSALVLFPFLRFNKLANWNLRTIFLSVVLGVIGFTAPVSLETAGLAASTPEMAAIAIAMEPLFTAVIAAFMLRERLSKKRIIAFLLALFGAWVIAGFPRPGAPGYLVGDMLLLLSVICYAIYNTNSAKLSESVSPSAGAAATLLAGFITSIPVWVIAGAPMPLRITHSALVALLYLSLGATAVAYLLWQVILNRFQVSFAALFLYLQPIFGVVLSMLIVGTHPPAYFYGGGVIILGAIFLGQQQQVKKPNVEVADVGVST